MTSPRASAAEFDAFVGSLTRAYHLLTQISDRLHPGVTTGVRSILLLLARDGPMTLSEIAEHRAVSRQFIQRVGADLVARDWVKTEPNPRHKRSPKLRLTPAGIVAADGVRRREARLGPAISDQLMTLDLAATRQALDSLCDALTSLNAGGAKR